MVKHSSRSGPIAESTEYATVAEAARRLRLSPSTVWRWIDSGKLTAYRIGPKAIRIKTTDLAAMIQPTHTTRKAGQAAVDTFPSPSLREIARRKALVAETLALREQLPIAPLTAADLIRNVREDEQPADDPTR